MTLCRPAQKYHGQRHLSWITVFLTFLIIQLTAQTAHATTYNAVSAALTDVQNAINLASDGDTVVVPAGSATWTSQITVTTAITLKGAGINSTVITSTLGGALYMNSDNKGESRVTGFTFNGGGSETFGPVTLTGIGVRCDNCLFTNCALFSLQSYNAFGVIDHCIFEESDGGVYVQDPGLGGNSYGDGSWTNADNWGTTNFLVMENDSFYGIGQVGCVDGCAGGRWVFRYNYVTNDVLVAHGTDSTGRARGTRAVEVYDNVFTCPGGFAGAFELRSGTAVLFSNYCTGFNGNIVTLKNFRSPSCGVPGTYPPWGTCTGTDPYDGDTDANGYPAIDQCGRGVGDLMADTTPGSGVPVDTVTGKEAWPNEVSDPIYEWGNFNNGGPAVIGACSALFNSGRDFFDGIVKPGYTPLVYPHPLDTSATNSSSPSFTLTVINGTGSGNYSSNAVVSIFANAANTVSNGAFAFWNGSDVANTNLATTSVAMPASNLTVTANYVPYPPANLNVIK